MNTRERGRTNELKAKKYWEALGYRCQLAPMPTRWATQQDWFGLWDLCCVNDKETLWIQVKTNRVDTYGKKLDAHRAWIVPPHTRKLLMLYETSKPEITELLKTLD